MRILIVEDSANVASVIQEYLAPVAEDIVIVGSFKEAKEELAKSPSFDIVTLDLGLPDSSTLNTLRVGVNQLKRINPNCLIIVISGMLEEDAEIAEYGADGFMHKATSIAKGRNTFLGTLADIGRSILRLPEQYQKNIVLSEKLTTRISDCISKKTIPLK